MVTQTLREQTRLDFPLKQTPAGLVHYRHFSSPEAVFSYLKTRPDLTAVLQERYLDRSESFLGVEGQKFPDLVATGYGKNALKQFHKAAGTFTPESLAVGGRNIPAVTGGAWCIPAYLSGNPLCARIKPRAKLPTKAFHIAFRASASVNQADITKTTAALAKALWAYTLQGGGVSLKITYIFKYTDPAPDGAKALLISISAPLSAETSFSTAFSTALYRGVLMGIASMVTSGQREDSIPHGPEFAPLDSINLDGRSVSDRAKLNAVGIAC